MEKCFTLSKYLSKHLLHNVFICRTYALAIYTVYWILSSQAKRGLTSPADCSRNLPTTSSWAKQHQNTSKG